MALNVPGEVRRAFVSVDVPLVGTVGVGGTARLEDARYKVSAQAYRAASLELRLGFDGPWDFPMRFTGMALRRGYGAPSISSNGNRVDRAWAAGVSMEIDTISIWGASPIIGVSYQQQDSNERLAVYRRASIILGLSRLF